MGIGMILSGLGAACTVGGYVIDRFQAKVDAEEAAEKVYLKHHPEEQENKEQKRDESK